MSEFLLLLLSTALVNNVVLIKFLGLCPVMGVSKSVDSAFGMGLADLRHHTGGWRVMDARQLDAAAPGPRLSAHPDLHPGHRGGRPIH
jgi:hypothetical protein